MIEKVLEKEGINPLQYELIIQRDVASVANILKNDQLEEVKFIPYIKKFKALHTFRCTFNHFIQFKNSKSIIHDRAYFIDG